MRANKAEGNQAHMAQSVETRADGFIAYALGNFVYDQTERPEQMEGYLVEGIFKGGELVNVRLRPIEILDQYRPVFAEEERGRKILGDVVTASQALPEE